MTAIDLIIDGSLLVITVAAFCVWAAVHDYRVKKAKREGKPAPPPPRYRVW